MWNINFGKLIILVKLIKAVPLRAMEALGGRGGIAPTHPVKLILVIN
jgi:hypothetical protein